MFIDPGFPVQKMQLQVQGVKYETFDVYDYRGEKLAPKLESYLCKGNICAIVFFFFSYDFCTKKDIFVFRNHKSHL